MNILLDTHVWLWYLSGSDRISKKLVKLIDDPENSIWLSSISVWESLVLAEKKKIKIKGDPQVWVREALNIFPVNEASLNHEIAIASRSVKLPHKDPADRFIVATALIYDLFLATYDNTIKKSYKKIVIQ